MKSYLLILLIHGLSELLLEQHNNLLNVLAGDHFEGNAKSLSPDINVGAGENTQNFHGQVIQNTLIANSQLIDTVQHNKLDVVVRLPDRKLDQLSGGGLHGDRVAGKGSKGGGSFVDDGAGRGVEQFKHELEVPRL